MTYQILNVLKNPDFAQKKNLFFNDLTPPCFACETLLRARVYPGGNRHGVNPASQET